MCGHKGIRRKKFFSLNVGKFKALEHIVNLTYNSHIKERTKKISKKETKRRTDRRDKFS